MDAAVVTVACMYTGVGSEHVDTDMQTDWKGQNVEITKAMLPYLTKADIARLTYGSKVEFSAWFSYVTLIWCLKFTMLCF